ncbi:ABC transporter ATP-binding protein [Serinicoccus sp. CNJ-927]|uniref:ABC transporter ATP-binding protein n=1 Tax=Serinicoccus sp. CNJ-927 TaxID=1904970 RepID=UPI00095A07C6|nr:ABC transporter ATP-binding protein [Serinicoccus sp. CNJ-927]OLT43441.1 ABC transporter ATP-binding protein [Serinicoccus sp. CNJ-927]
MTTPDAQQTPGTGISVRGLTKRFGSFTAVDDLTFEVAPGRVTGFLGPNGAGKTTTLRMLLGLISPTAGEALIGGRRYADLAQPMSTVGAALEATGFHPGRTGRNHLRVLAATHGIPDSRVDELLDLVGIPAAARKKAGGYSMGMRQRLGLAAALLGDPDVLLLDEPANGLDPEGIRWMRGFMRHLAAEQGKTVLVSSHLLGEVEQTVEDVVIIANGRLVRRGTMDELHGEPAVLARTADPGALGHALEQAGLQVEVAPDQGEGALRVHTGDLAAVGDVALAAGQPVHELRPLRTDLERLFLELTESPEHRNRNRSTGTEAA